MELMKKIWAVMGLLGLLAASTGANSLEERLKELVDQDNGVEIEGEKDALGAVVNMPLHPLADCEISPVLYALANHKSDALKALLALPGVEPLSGYAHNRESSNGLPRLGLLHVAALATSDVAADDDNEYAALTKDMVCGQLVRGQGQETWDIVKTIPRLDVSVKTVAGKGSAKSLRYVDCTPLHMAAATNQSAIAVRELLDMANVDVLDSGCKDKEVTFSPLELAVIAGNHAAVAALIAKDSKVLDQRSKDAETILHLAARMMQPAATSAILQSPAGREMANMVDANGWTPLHVACMEGFYNVRNMKVQEVVRDLLAVMTAEAANSQITGAYLHVPQKPKSRKQSVRSVSPGKTALILAILGQRADLAEILLADPSGVIDPNVGDSKSSFSPLHVSAFYNMVPVIEMLLKHPKIDVNMRTRKGKRTPLHTACRAGSAEAVSVLLADPWIDTEAKDSGGYKPVEWATGFYYNNPKIREMFTEYYNVTSPVTSPVTSINSASVDAAQTDAVKEEL